MDNTALFKMTYGMFLLTAKENGFDNGCIINTAVQVAENPIKITISVIKDTKTCDMILNTHKFNLSSITESADFDLFKRFGMQSGKDVDKFADFSDVSRSENGLFYLTENSNIYLSADVIEHIDLGSHILFIAELTDAVKLREEPSCSYSYYHSDIKPKPKTTQKKQWVCTICGYVYEGEEVPDDYLCPLCKHGKEYFEPIKE